MRKELLIVAAVILAIATPSVAAQKEVPPQAVERIQKEVRHEVLMLPYFDVFDNIAFKVDYGERRRTVSTGQGA